MTTLLLIRHAENDYTLKGKLAGWTEGVGLNEQGRAQADALAKRLEKAPLKAIYSSPLERALETAAPLARSRRMPVVRRAPLGEIKYGRWTGKSLKVLRRTRLWLVVQHSPSLMRFPEGESFAEAQARVVEEIETLRAFHPKDLIACFSHGDVIKLAVAYYIGLPLDQFQRLAVDTASITTLHIVDGGARLLRLNDVGLPASPPAN